jgi:hypothetical protein
MKKNLLLIFIPLFFLITISSCSIEKRLFLPGYNVSWRTISNEKKVSLCNYPNHNNENRVSDTININNDYDSIDENLTASIDGSYIVENINRNIQNNSNIEVINIIQQITNDSCDKIILKNGTAIWAKEIELNATGITYKNCDSLDEKISVLKTSEISLIQYADGSQDIFTSDGSGFVSESKNKSNNKKYIDGIGLVSFTLGILGAIIAGIPFGITSIVLGIISRGKINRNPARFVGRGFSVAGIILGFLDIIAVLILISMI